MRPGPGRAAVRPTRAGVVRRPAAGRRPQPGPPRTRGGGPFPASWRPHPAVSAPHARGWSGDVRSRVRRPGVRPARAGVVLQVALEHPRAPVRPARAGVVRVALPLFIVFLGPPRTRGGGPFPNAHVLSIDGSAPHARGWSDPDFAGRDVEGVHPARGSGPWYFHASNSVMAFASHARGWSGEDADAVAQAGVRPARAGVFRTRSQCCPRTPRPPRTRGGGPSRGVDACGAN